MDAPIFWLTIVFWIPSGAKAGTERFRQHRVVVSSGIDGISEPVQGEIRLLKFKDLDLFHLMATDEIPSWEVGEKIADANPVKTPILGNKGLYKKFVLDKIYKIPQVKWRNVEKLCSLWFTIMPLDQKKFPSMCLTVTPKSFTFHDVHHKTDPEVTFQTCFANTHLLLHQMFFFSDRSEGSTREVGTIRPMMHVEYQVRRDPKDEDKYIVVKDNFRPLNKSNNDDLDGEVESNSDGIALMPKCLPSSGTPGSSDSDIRTIKLAFGSVRLNLTSTSLSPPQTTHSSSSPPPTSTKTTATASNNSTHG